MSKSNPNARRKQEDSISKNMKSIVLSIDVGSSSIRCSAYLYQYDDDDDDDKMNPCKNIERNLNEEKNHFSFKKTFQKSIAAHAIPLKSVEPTPSARIRVHDILEYVDECVDRVLGKLRGNSEIGSFCISVVGISTFVMNLIGVDDDGNPVSFSEYSCDDEHLDGTNNSQEDIKYADASFSYACSSTEVAEDCVDILQNSKICYGNESHTVKAIHNQTGCYIHSSYALPQLRCFYRKYKDHPVMNNLKRWTTIGSLIISRWTLGQHSVTNLPISCSEASWTGMLDFHCCEWSKLLIEDMGLITEQFLQHLPDIRDPSDCNSLNLELTNTSNCMKEFRWNEMKGAMLVLGIGDGAAANIGCKATSPSRIAATIGTSAAARMILKYDMIGNSNTVLSKNLEVPEGLWCYRIDRRYVLIGGALTDGGNVIDWARRFLNLTDEAAFMGCLKEVDEHIKHDRYHACQSNNNEPLMVIPFLSGAERSTGWRSKVSGSILHINKTTTSADLMRACMEGITLRLSAILTLLLKKNGSHKSNDVSSIDNEAVTCLVSGTALERNSTWRRMLADWNPGMIRIVVDKEGVIESTSRGAAIFASQIIRCNANLREEELCIDSVEFTELNTNKAREKYIAAHKYHSNHSHEVFR